MKRLINKIRIKVKKMKKENPRFFDWTIRIIEIVWFVISTFWTAIASNKVVTVGILIMTFCCIHLAQGMKITNKFEREKRVSQKKYNRNMKKMGNYYEDTVIFMHRVAHEIKMQTAQMPNQRLGTTRNNMINFFNELLNSLEDLLSRCYDQKVCASIKLCTKDGKIRSCARGQNNVESRGGEARVKLLNARSISVEDNYAYKSIIQQKVKYFAEGDLKKLKRKEKKDDIFFCEYGEEWTNLFRASIIIPIRYPILSEMEESYKILGLVCIDAPQIQASWSQGEISYAYQLVAYVADVIYWQLECYMQSQKNMKMEMNGGEK